MPRYVVQRTFPDGLLIPVGNGGADVCLAVIERNSEDGVTWIHSYVSEDKRRRSASTTRPTRKRSEGPRPATSSRSTGSPRSACSTPTSTSKEHPMLSTMSNSILSAPRGRRCRQLTMAFAALAALSTVAPTAQANPYAVYGQLRGGLHDPWQQRPAGRGSV